MFSKSIFEYFSKQILTCARKCSSKSGPLSNVRILDLSRILAGPFCTMVLGDLGAEIIKVENPVGGDETRKWGPPFVNEESAYFLSVNRNKKSIGVDIRVPEGQELIKKLTLKSDVLIENYLPGKLASYGLDYENIQKIAPHLVYCSITGYGSTGPYSNRAGFDVIAASVGGLVSITGHPDQDPCKVGVAVTDLATGLYAHGAILAALIEKSKSGRGQWIECDLLSTQVSLLVNIASNYLNVGKEAKRWGTAHESLVPYQTFKTNDGYITIGAGSDKMFGVLCKVLNAEHLATDSLFATNKDRVKNRKVLVSSLAEIFSLKCTQYWLEAFEGSGIPYGPVNSIGEVFNDPQVIHRNMVVNMEHPKTGKIKLPAPAVKYSNSENKARMPPPSLGEHTDDVLSNVLSLTKEEIQALRSAKVVS